MNPRKPKEHRITKGTSISMTPAMVRELDEIAEREGRSRSNLIVLFVREKVAEYNAKQKKESEP
jgi:metal-responsive CopG/Arc/MetJ family transcriptional regulator